MKTRALTRYLLSAAALTAVLSFAPLTAQAGSCICSGKPDAPPAVADSQQTCDFMCGGSGGTYTASTAPAGGGKTEGLENPLGNVCGDAPGQKCVQLIIGNVIRAALGVSGSIALLMMTWGGFLWLTSMGNNEKVEKGKTTLIWATLGLVLIFGAYALTSYIITAIAAGGK